MTLQMNDQSNNLTKHPKPRFSTVSWAATQSKLGQIRFRFGMLFCRITFCAIVIASLVSTSTFAQEPDRQGWSGGFQVQQNNSLQPLNDIAPVESTWDSQAGRQPVNQIGLTSFEEPVEQQSNPADLSKLFSPEQFTSREGLGSSLQAILLIATLSLAPAIILMTTCYVRVIVVLTLLKQAFGAQQLPPMQVLTALSLFITMLIMTPVWNQIKTDAIDPYTQSENGISWDEAWNRGVVPVKTFMANQIIAADNDKAVAMFYEYLPDKKAEYEGQSDQNGKAPISAHNVPLSVLLPAFVVSELKVAFLIGFQIYLPFLVLDLVVASVTVSTGMLMLPPTMVSFPLKLIMFVLVDGWNLVVGMLLQSFNTYS